MIDIRNKKDCCGCTACVSVCPAQCIVMRRDREEGFDYPVANPDICIGCGKCETVCPVLNPFPERHVSEAYAARSREDCQESSSGGIFPKLAETVVAREGVVYGAAFDSDFSVSHTSAETMDDVARMQGSKYVQSELYSAFEDVKYELERGRKVMFAGTPCQVAGLLRSLGKDHEGLLTVDFACHGVPGPGLWEMYLRDVEARLGTMITDIRFRDKSRSWCHYDFVVNGRRTPYMDDPYMALFVQDVTLRPSCYTCPVRNGRSGSDITLADLWSVAASAPHMNDDKGVSLVCINTDKGRDAFDEIKPFIGQEKVVYEEAVRNNGGFAENVAVPERREEFFKGMNSAKDLYGYMSGFVIRPSAARRFIRYLRLNLSRIKRTLFS